MCAAAIDPVARGKRRPSPNMAALYRLAIVVHRISQVELAISGLLFSCLITVLAQMCARSESDANQIEKVTELLSNTRT
jgi:hypothetical protein